MTNSANGGQPTQQYSLTNNVWRKDRNGNFLDKDGNITTDRTRYRLITAGTRPAVKDTLKRYGYDNSYLDQLDDDQLMELLATAQDNDINYSQRTRDRQDTMTDFAKQLGQLTGSKQRQAELAGRIAQNAQRTQGLASMMDNF